MNVILVLRWPMLTHNIPQSQAGSVSWASYDWDCHRGFGPSYLNL